MKIVKIIIDILLILIIVLLSGYFVLRAINKIEIYNVKTGSMEDNIHVGDYILILKKTNYKVGDIVTYKREDYMITHRIVKIENDTYITKGDANNTEDEAIKKDSIVGKVVLNGGILNIIIDYKFVLVGFLIILYLISCFIGKSNKEGEIEAVD